MKKTIIHVLLIEDNQIDAVSIQEALSITRSVGLNRPRFTVKHVGRLQTALDHLNAQENVQASDVILCDPDLPDSRAQQTIATLREQAPDLPLIVLTEDQDEALAQASVQVGVQDYLYKNVMTSNLLARAILYALERHGSKQALQCAHDQLEQRVTARTAELERTNADLRQEVKSRAQMERALRKRTRDLRERVKELTCLYDMFEIMNQPQLPWDKILHKIVRLIPPAWQYPEITCARIRVDDHDVRTENYQETDATLTSSIVVQGRACGRIEVGYLEPRPESNEGPFLREERDLLDVMALQLGRYVERHQIESELAKTNAQLHAFLNNSPALISIFDGKGRYHLVNRAAAEVLGRAPEEVAGKSFVELLPIGAAATFMKRIAQVKKKEIPLRVEDHLMVAGKERIFETVLFPIVQDTGQTPLFGSIANDVTSRKHLEQEMRWQAESDEAVANLASALLESASLEEVSNLVLQHARYLTGSATGYVGYVDPKTNTLMCSPQDTTPEERAIFEECTGLNRWMREQHEPFLTNAPEKGLHGIQLPGGAGPIHRFLLAPALLNGALVGQIALANARSDYTERDLALAKRLASLYALALQCQEIQREVRGYTAEMERLDNVLSHDLQAPARTIQNVLKQLAENYGKQLDTQAAEQIAYAREKAELLQEMVRGLLRLSQVETQAHAFTHTDIQELLQDTLTELRPLIETIEAQVTHTELPQVVADRTQLAQVFRNLMENALKFRREDVPLHVHVSARQEDHTWVFAVADNGIGIAPEEANRIFRVFQKLHPQTEYEGLGIGLALCRQIVERHGGRIWVESELGAGSTFFFTLPTRAVPESGVD